MFKKIFIDLCNQNKEAPSAVCVKLGLSNAAYSKWDDNSIPRRATLQRISDYFGVSVDYLLGNMSASPAIDDSLLARIATLDEEQMKQLDNYVDFLIEKKKK